MTGWHIPADLDRERVYTALRARGEAYAARWLVPLIPEAAELCDRGGEPEWALPKAHWDAELMDGPVAATFFGWPVVRDDALSAPAVRDSQ